LFYLNLIFSFDGISCCWFGEAILHGCKKKKKIKKQKKKNDMNEMILKDGLWEGECNAFSGNPFTNQLYETFMFIDFVVFVFPHGWLKVL